MALYRKVTEALAGDQHAHAGLRQGQRVAALGQLTSGVAHDFNNLLQTISGSVQLIQRKADEPDKVRRWAEGALSAVEHGAKLTAQLLAFSREQQPEAESLRVARRVGEMAELLARAIGPRSACTSTWAPARPAPRATPPSSKQRCSTWSSTRATRWAAWAVSASRRGWSTSRTTASCPTARTSCWTVVDDGPGMPPDVAARAFEPFFTTKQAGKGTGLGLAQVYGFAARAGGVARIDSVAGQGTSIALYLASVSSVRGGPADAAERSEPLDTTQQPTTTPGRATRLLLVDDDAALRHSLGALLADAGYVVTLAASGAIALQAIADAVPDVVLMDCAMQGMNGATLARKVRELDADVPIVFLTGYADIGELLPTLGVGARVLQKPLLLDGVKSAIEGALAASRAGRGENDGRRASPRRYLNIEHPHVR